MVSHTDEKGEVSPARSKLAKKMNGGSERHLQLIRHGATRLNNDDVSVDRIRGWKDVPLSPDGKSEAESLAKVIAKNPPDALFSSDLCRAEETASIIAKACGLKMEKATKDFRPWNVGEFAGQKSKEAVPILAEYATETPDKPVPGGESFNSFRGRFFKGLLKALQSNDGLVAVVSHHRAERLLKAWAKAGFPKDGAIDEAEFSKKGEPTGHCEILKIPLARLATAAR